MALASPKGQAGSNLKEVKIVNRAVVFRTIREAGAISRAELATRTGLNPATLTHITRELLQQGMIEESGFGESRLGRRRSLLHVNPDLGYVISVRLSRHNIQGMLTDLELQRTVKETLTSSSLSQPLDVTLPDLLDLIQTLITKSGVATKDILGIGICAPGPLDARRGVLISPPNFPGWPNTPIRQIVEEKTGFATFLDNDANGAALAEKWFGTGREKENFAYILVEDGVGSGVVIQGDIYRGEHDAAGEIGHTTVDLNGQRCDCGNSGCLELYASPLVAEKFVRTAIAAGESSLVLNLAGQDPECVTFELIAQAARRGDSIANQALQSIARALSVGVVNMINVFDPETVIIGGKIDIAGDLILPVIQDVVIHQTLPRGEKPVQVLLSEFGSDAPVIGAFSLVLRELFQNPAFHSAFHR